MIIMNTNQIYNKLVAGLFCCFLFIVPCFLSSCESWVDVTPDDRIVETTVFERQQGYQKLLNGLYSGMTSSSLYGKNLSVLNDLLAKVYNIGSSHYYSSIAHYQYGDTDAKSLTDPVWEKGYSLIANANTIIEHTNDADCPLSDRQKSRIKAEALAVRAYLHLDLLRLFGPIPSEFNKQAIPYQTSSKLDVMPFESGTQVMNKIKADLNEAASLLQNSEPLLFPDMYDADDIDSRPFRMNYFAVKAILARAYLYEGDKTNAFREATEVINAGEKFFPASSNRNDRLFSSEILFGLYDMQRAANIHNAVFSPTLNTYKLLTVSGTLGSGRLAEWYDDLNDYRYRVWALDVVDGVDIVYLQKFNTALDAGIGNFAIPLVRMGEMYLIAAECAAGGADAGRYINTLRNRRNCFSVEVGSDNLRDCLTLEYRKELLGEGQLFFYFKRCEMQQLPYAEQASGSATMNLGSYVVPLPDSERSMRAELSE